MKNETEQILKDIEDVAESLRNLADECDNLAKMVRNEKSDNADIKEESALEAKKISKEEVRGALSAKSADGYIKEIKALLIKYGAERFSELKEEHYQDVLMEAKEIGNE